VNTSKEEHRGRYFFWFNKELFSPQWFTNFVAEGIANAGPRYTPEIHVGLPIADLFDGLGRTAAFYAWITETYGAMKRAYSKVQFDTNDTRIETLLAEMREDARRLFPLLENVGDSGVDMIEFEAASRLAFRINEKAWEVSGLLDERKRSTRTSAVGRSGKEQPVSPQPDSGYQRQLLSELSRRAAEGSVARNSYSAIIHPSDHSTTSSGY
jgi:hypothetical protein